MLVLLAPGFVDSRGAAAPIGCTPARLLVGAAALPGLAWTAFKVGALSYGGGFVIIPLMQEDAVERHGWMTERSSSTRSPSASSRPAR